jgi:transcriptional regulator with XRE-family HTH domain
MRHLPPQNSWVGMKVAPHGGYMHLRSLWSPRRRLLARAFLLAVPRERELARSATIVVSLSSRNPRPDSSCLALASKSWRAIVRNSGHKIVSDGTRAVPVSGVQPELLKWARVSANMTTADVAEKIKKEPDDIEAWEAGRGAPSYSQLERLAYDIYKRPLAIFFLPAAPEEPKPRTEFRSLPDADLSLLKRETVLLIRKAHAFQTALDELYQGRNPAEHPIWREIRLTTERPVTVQAEYLRTSLGVSIDQVRAEPDDDAALKLWRRAVEARGVFVFKDSFKQREISGFCLRHDEFPVIVINNSTTKTRQIFSLVHELAHLLFNRNGISRFDNAGIDDLPPQDRAIERFCNSLAAEVLVPALDFATAVREWGHNPHTREYKLCD